MNKNSWAKKIAKCAFPLAAMCLLLTQQSCLEEYAPGNYYTFTGNTVASFLESEGYKEDFTYFVEVLKRAEIWGEMRTYGTYTCFAPTNAGFEDYFKEKGVSSVAELTKEQCDTIAKTHICNSLFYCKDLVVGALPYPNRLDRYLVYTCDSATDEHGKMDIVYRLNQQSTIVERDDSVQNGVVQIVDRVLSPSNKMLPDVMELDPNIRLFVEALKATKMTDSLTAYMDDEYELHIPSYDSIDPSKGIRYATGMETNQIGIFPEHRYFKFTAFVETDSVFESYGITSLQDLVDYVTPIYEESFPSATYDKNDYTDRNHPLNRFVSYHLLPEQMAYNEFNISQKELTDYYVEWANIDIEDIFETMMPHSIMRLSSPKVGGRYINRKGAGKTLVEPGVRVFSPSESAKAGDAVLDQTAINGVYHYIDKLLLYDKKTREETLNTRLRIMCQTLSPDYINSGARGRLSSDVNGNWTMGFKPGFCKNVQLSEETQAWVRYRNNTFTCFFGEEITIMGRYDVTFRLPPVPTEGTYELRMYMCTMKDSGMQGFTSDRGVVQIYLNDVPQGIPVDLRLNQLDVAVTGDGKKANKSDDEEVLRAKERAMHSRGYMLAPDSYSAQGSINLRWDREDCLRKIIATDYFYPEVDYFIRIRLVLDNPTACCPFNMIELVPKSIYAGDIPEDTH